jgi:hypothetical protein
MGLAAEIRQAWFDRRRKTFRAVQAIAATPTNLFTISGGPVRIFGLTAWIVNAITTAVTWHITCAGVPLDAALFAALAGANTMCEWPMTVAANIAPAAAAPSPTILADTAHAISVVSVPGNITLTYAAALIDGTVGFTVTWEALAPASNIVAV